MGKGVVKGACRGAVLLGKPVALRSALLDRTPSKARLHPSQQQSPKVCAKLNDLDASPLGTPAPQDPTGEAAGRFKIRRT
jgi:hypothetical protein